MNFCTTIKHIVHRKLLAEWRLSLPHPFPEIFSVERANVTGATSDLRFMMCLMNANLGKTTIHTKFTLNEKELREKATRGRWMPAISATVGLLWIHLRDFLSSFAR